MKKLLPCLLISSLPFCLAAQINFPRISPDAGLRQHIGLTEIAIHYSRPGMRGRTVMGNLVPWGRIWRVGANESTKITNTDTLWVANHVLPPGTYALYAFPQPEEWTMVFHKNTSHWGDGRDQYDPSEDAFRLQITPQQLRDTVETLTLEWSDFTHQSAVLNIDWELTRISIPVRVNTHAKVMAEIYQKLEQQPTADTYYQAGRYLQEEGRHPEQALQWLDRAIELGGDTYYFHRVRSLVLAQLGRYKEAIPAAQRSLTLAEALGKDEFVRMNQTNITRWKKKARQDNKGQKK